MVVAAEPAWVLAAVNVTTRLPACPDAGVQPRVPPAFPGPGLKVAPIGSPWSTLRAVVRDARNEAVTEQSAIDTLNNHLEKCKLPRVADLGLPDSLDSQPFRKALGAAAAAKKGWFKTIDAGERVAAIVGPTLEEIGSTPFAQGIGLVRSWIDG